MSGPQIRCLICGGRGGWSLSGEFREQCTHCQQTGWEPNPSAYLADLVADLQDHDGFTPGGDR